MDFTAEWCANCKTAQLNYTVPKEVMFSDHTYLSGTTASLSAHFARIAKMVDRRYAIDCRKIETELGWTPAETFESGIAKTVQWYLDHPDWVARVQSGAYRDWIATQYGESS